ncbi:hypothetical protein IVA88_10555 [Bradyrhizobium sp. 149]|uniref:hypothetical protein n=1 Tax=Bradyrhizobium sp. 149 TaxID=2782624 RepID=UPI001FFAAEA6|nr:hypothetical protein [Bradyrhizobium sp. 149]MCK1651876.1 hypothetical protein [Bradyrhizobium sp. 149]
MTRWIGAAAACGLIVALTGVSIAATPDAAKSKASASARDIDARRHARHHDAVRQFAPAEPRYYARPVYYRPYPYGVPAPFVLGFGPWW